MVPSYKYAIAQLEANPQRGERLNLAIVVFSDEGLSVHSARSFEKVRAISAALDTSVISESLSQLVFLDEHVRSEGAISPIERLAEISCYSSMAFSQVGEFFAADANAYEASVKRLVAQLVDPEPAPRKKPVQKRTKLLSSMKAALRSEKIMARKGEGLDSHRFVVNEELAEGLNADLMLKNGAMHIVQSVDASHTERVRRAVQEIGISALVFEQARIRFGADFTKPRLVYSANSQLEKSIQPALVAAEHQGASLINWESQDDRVSFIVDMSSLAEPTDEQKKASFGQVHASTHDRIKIN